MYNSIVALLILAVIPLNGASKSYAPDCARGQTVAFEGVNVLTMDGAAVLRERTVVVRDGRIASVGTSSSPDGACRVAGRGKYLLPGLSDMHAHMTEKDLPLFLANGVTLVREMNGSPAHLSMRAKLASGELTGPRLVVASPLLTGKKLQYRHRLITSEEDAFAAAHEASDAGYSFLKIYDDLSLEMYEAFVQAGKTLGLPLDGHVPQAVGLQRALDAGQSVQHMDKIAFAVGGHSTDPGNIDKVKAMFAGRQTWVTPTLASLHALGSAGSNEYRARLASPEMIYVDKDLLGWWKSMANGSRDSGPTPFTRYLDAVTKAVHESGARILIGTDASNPLMIPGFSVHEEMDALVKYAGFTRLEVLTAATRGAAEFLGDSTGGRVRAGSRAELLLVDDNPLENLSTLGKPVGVMAGGQWLDRAALDAGLKKSERDS
jgi:imidazolonepropionase-like amidohydrolase